ncbi:MAG: hypothetical protein MUP98_14590 [Candidatus Aminicenantes bacterium]|nr:hypothetical protein [Candidatus Aminicenantes bacterium]
MTKKSKRVVVFLVLVFGALPLATQGLRDLKVGDKLPKTEALSVFNVPKNKLILCLNSGRENNISFFQEIVPILEEQKNVTLFLVDVNQSLDNRIGSNFNSLRMEKSYIPDADHKIFSDLGIIVLPTILFVDKMNVLHSYLASNSSNIRLIVKTHLEAFLEGKKPDDLAQIYQKRATESMTNRYLEQAFQMMIDREHELALSLFKKAAEADPRSETAHLGIGFTQIFMQKYDDSIDYFTKLTSDNNDKRIQFGLYLSQAAKQPTEENLSKIAEMSQIETQFFIAVYMAAEILDRAGKTEESKNTFRHAYDILFKTYRKK